MLEGPLLVSENPLLVSEPRVIFDSFIGSSVDSRGHFIDFRGTSIVSFLFLSVSLRDPRSAPKETLLVS